VEGPSPAIDWSHEPTNRSLTDQDDTSANLTSDSYTFTGHKPANASRKLWLGQDAADLVAARNRGRARAAASRGSPSACGCGAKMGNGRSPHRGQALTAFPRVRSSEAFRRRPPILDRSLAPARHLKPFTIGDLGTRVPEPVVRPKADIHSLACQTDPGEPPRWIEFRDRRRPRSRPPTDRSAAHSAMWGREN
jgi:hypothetical protein